jgi:hypothetical protein
MHIRQWTPIVDAFQTLWLSHDLGLSAMNPWMKTELPCPSAITAGQLWQLQVSIKINILLFDKGYDHYFQHQIPTLFKIVEISQNRYGAYCKKGIFFFNQ